MAYKVSKADEQEYRNFIQRANRLIKAQVKYLDRHNITNEHTRRSIAGIYANKDNWAIDKDTGRKLKSPLNSSLEGRSFINPDTGKVEFREFKNKQEFRLYMAHLDKWGKERGRISSYDKFIVSQQEGKIAEYKDRIINSLQEVADQFRIPREPDDKLPPVILKELDTLTLTQITNFFEGGHPSEDMMIQEFDTITLFKSVNSKQDFIDTVMARLGQLKKFR